jgi:hypothetical protein
LIPRAGRPGRDGLTDQKSGHVGGQFAGRCIAALRWDEAARELPAGHALGPAEILFKKLDAGELFGE